MKWKHTDSPVKEKFQAQQSVIVFWDMEGHNTIDFLEKGATINSTTIANSLR